MEIDSAIAFEEGKTYAWRWATNDELDDYRAEYVFGSELVKHMEPPCRHFLGLPEVEEFFC